MSHLFNSDQITSKGSLQAVYYSKQKQYEYCFISHLVSSRSRASGVAACVLLAQLRALHGGYLTSAAAPVVRAVPLWSFTPRVFPSQAPKGFVHALFLFQRTTQSSSIAWGMGKNTKA